jgi:hypothetical protein
MKVTPRRRITVTSSLKISGQIFEDDVNGFPPHRIFASCYNCSTTSDGFARPLHHICATKSIKMEIKPVSFLFTSTRMQALFVEDRVQGNFRRRLRIFTANWFIIVWASSFSQHLISLDQTD